MNIYKRHREVDPASDYNPDCPEVGDAVKVYNSSNGWFFVFGRVVKYNETSDVYTIRVYTRGGEVKKTYASSDRVEIVNEEEFVSDYIPKG